MIRGPDRGAATEAVRLHRRSLGATSADPLGERSLLAVYDAALRSGTGFLVVAAEGGELRGAALATTDAGRVPPIVMRSPARWAWTIVRGIAGRGPIARWIERRSGGRTPGGPAAELLVIAVEPGFRSRGIGRALLDELHAELGSRGVAAYKVLVGRARSDAIRFYLANGFALARTFSRWGLEWDVYVRTLA